MSDTLSTSLSTPSNGPGRPKDQLKRQAILDAAKQLFLQQGYEGTSMDAIASAAGVSKLTLYSHFTDKETLFACAVAAKCEEQLPATYFELAADVPIEASLLAIGRGFNTLVNSDESLALQRLMTAQGGQNLQLAQLFFNAGPQRMLDAMHKLLEQACQRGQLQIDNPARAAEHFFCLIRGGCNFRLLIGLCEPLRGSAAEEHVSDVVGLFLRAYRASS